MQLNIESLSIPLGTELLHGGTGGAQDQLQVCLRGRRGLGARGGRLGVYCPPIQTHTAPLGIPFEPVSLPGSKTGLSCHTAPTPISLHVPLQKHRKYRLSNKESNVTHAHQV